MCSALGCLKHLLEAIFSRVILKNSSEFSPVGLQRGSLIYTLGMCSNQTFALAAVGEVRNLP